jgi:hypothetical protein
VQPVVFVAVEHGGEPFVAGEGLFLLGFGPEPGAWGPAYPSNIWINRTTAQPAAGILPVRGGGGRRLTAAAPALRIR